MDTTSLWTPPKAPKPPKTPFIGWMSRCEFEDLRLPRWKGVALRRFCNRDAVFVAPIPLNYLFYWADRLYWSLAFPRETDMKRKAMSIIALDRLHAGHAPRICPNCGFDTHDEKMP